MSGPTGQQTEPPVPGSAAAFGAALKARRNRTGRSLQALSQRVSLSTSTLSRYEQGQCLPPDKHLSSIFDALGVPNPERLTLLRELEQARAELQSVRPQPSPAIQHRSGAVVAAIRRYWRSALRVIVVAFALVGVAATIGYLVVGWPADRGPDHAGHSADCDRFTVASTHLALRDSYSAPFAQLPQDEVLTVIQRSNPRGLPYWEVTTATHQEGWVDARYLRPSC